jgi:deferrochelatase/peroxidase EfeB
MIVGRFRDGTPLTTQRGDGAHSPIMNDFDYDSDDLAGKCPFYGHVRKTNPRGSGGFEPQSNQRLHLMARRGQTYGNHTDNPTDRACRSAAARQRGSARPVSTRSSDRARARPQSPR